MQSNRRETYFVFLLNGGEGKAADSNGIQTLGLFTVVQTLSVYHAVDILLQAAVHYHCLDSFDSLLFYFPSGR